MGRRRRRVTGTSSDRRQRVDNIDVPGKKNVSVIYCVTRSTAVF